MKEPIEYIKKIKVNQANFEHIASTGNINGTLLNDLIGLISEVKNDALLSNTNQAKEEKCILPNFDKSGQCFKCGIYVENHFHPSKD